MIMNMKNKFKEQAYSAPEAVLSSVNFDELLCASATSAQLTDLQFNDQSDLW